MDLYSSDLRLSDIGLAPEEREILAREYPLGMLDEEDEDSCIFNPYSPGSSSGYEDSQSNADILLDVVMNPQVVDGRGTLMEVGEAASSADVEGMLDVLNSTGTNLQWIDSFLQSTTSISDCQQDHASIFIDEDLLVLGKNPRVKSEHSYSLANTPNSASTESGLSVDLDLVDQHGLKLEDVDGDDELSLEHEDVDVENDNTGLLFGSLVQNESAGNVGLVMNHSNTSGRGVTVRCVTSLDDLCDVKPDTDTLLADGRGVVSEEVALIDEEFIEYVKMEPEENNGAELANNNVTSLYKALRTSHSNSTKPEVYGGSGGAHIMLHLPPTPPPSSGCSSNSSSDSEASLSPTRSPSSSPSQQGFTTKQLSVRHNQNLWTATIHQPTGLSNNFTSASTSGSQLTQGGMVGTLYLTEEEKRTMIAEGYPLPSKLPLTKQEEKNLKKIRRKIKNKISAQESRRKKKEYLETLEKKVETVSQENNQLKKKVDILETNNRSLVSQLQRLQSLVNKLSPAVVQPTTCVLVS